MPESCTISAFKIPQRGKRHSSALQQLSGLWMTCASSAGPSALRVDSPLLRGGGQCMEVKAAPSDKSPFSLSARTPRGLDALCGSRAEVGDCSQSAEQEWHWA